MSRRSPRLSTSYALNEAYDRGYAQGRADVLREARSLVSRRQLHHTERPSLFDTAFYDSGPEYYTVAEIKQWARGYKTPALSKLADMLPDELLEDFASDYDKTKPQDPDVIIRIIMLAAHEFERLQQMQQS